MFLQEDHAVCVLVEREDLGGLELTHLVALAHVEVRDHLHGIASEASRLPSRLANSPLRTGAAGAPSHPPPRAGPRGPPPPPTPGANGGGGRRPQRPPKPPHHGPIAEPGHRDRLR